MLLTALYLNESEIIIAKCNLKMLILKFTDIANLFFFKRELSRLLLLKGNL